MTSRHTLQSSMSVRKTHADAKRVLRSKYHDEGQEPDCENELGRIEGMSTTRIRDYQTTGVAFMLRQERAKNDCRGGIIVDDMGIGKTIQAIACMLSNPQSKKAARDGRGASLIIVPNQGIGKQWVEEMI